MAGRKIVVSKAPRRLRQRWHFVMVAANGETIATSENYVNQGDCIKTARSIAATKSWPIEVVE